MADPVASGITIIETIRKTIRKAKELYDAPQELSALLQEVDQLEGVIKNIVDHCCPTEGGGGSLRTSVDATQACLLDIERLIQFSLIRDGPAGLEARRVAWLRKREEVERLQGKLGQCKVNLMLALSTEQAAIAKRSETRLHGIEMELQTLHVRNQDIKLCAKASHIRKSTAGAPCIDSFGRLEQLYERHWIDQKPQLASLHAHYEERAEELNQRYSLLLQRFQSIGDGREIASDNACIGVAASLELTDYPTSVSSAREDTETLSSWYDEDIRWSSGRGSWDAAPVKKMLRNIVGLLNSCEHAHGGPCALHEIRLSNALAGEEAVNWAPTRLLFVGSGAEDIRLVDKTYGGMRYTCLSYCWGGVARLVTTRSSLESRKRSIPWELIPELFRDAIHVTRSTGADYLWIDSVCILQDDAVDWEREAATMSDVYGHAHFTIAASASSDPSVGLLAQSWESSQAIEPSYDPGSRSKATYRAVDKCLRKENPLHKRAWALQERLLSRRVVHFDGTHIYWECPGQNALIDDVSCTRVKAIDEVFTSAQTALSRGCSKANALQAWGRLIEEYSRRKTTFASDKLIALSGIAKMFAAILGYYAAGLWLDHGTEALAWQVKKPTCRPIGTTAPSWSWLSVQGEIRAGTTSNFLSLAKLVRCHMNLLGQNRFGALHDSVLVLESVVLDATVEGAELYEDQALIHLRLSNGKTVAAEADTMEDWAEKSPAKMVSLATDPGGNIVCLVCCVVPNKDNCHWRRVGLATLYRCRGEHRLIDKAFVRSIVLE